MSGVGDTAGWALLQTAITNPVTGTGTSGKLAQWTGTNTIGEGPLATTIGTALLTLTNPGAITFPRFNVANTVDALSAADFKTALSLAKGDVGLGSVDNTSDATKNAAAVALTNKTGFNGLVITANTGTLGSSLIPETTDAYTLGTWNKLWNASYISKMYATIFALTTQTLFGGYSTIGYNAGTFAAAVASGDTTIDFGTTMTPGHFVLVRATDTSGSIPANGEYIQVGSNTAGTTYNVTRNCSSGTCTTAGTPPAWAKGTPFLVLGTTGTGRIDLLAFDGKPRISFTDQGATYNANTEYIRLGALDNFLGVAHTGERGIGIGKSTAYLIYNSTDLTLLSNKLTIDAAGIRLALPATYTDVNAYRFTPGAIAGSVYGVYAQEGVDGRDIAVRNTVTTTGKTATVDLAASNSTDAKTAEIRLYSNTQNVRVDGTLSVFTPSGTGAVDLINGETVFGYGNAIKWRTDVNGDIRPETTATQNVGLAAYPFLRMFTNALGLPDIAAPSPATNLLYSIKGVLYWNGTTVGTGSGYISGSGTAGRLAIFTGATALGDSLAHGAGWLHNDGAGTFAYSTPTAANVGADATGTAAGAVSTHAALVTGVHGITNAGPYTIAITANTSLGGTNTGDNATNSQYSGLVTFPGFGTSHSTAAYGDHAHAGVYDPAGTASSAVSTHAALQTGVHGISITAGKTLTASNSLTLTATDGSTLAIGTGGTLGTAAYTAATAYDASGAAATVAGNLSTHAGLTTTAHGLGASAFHADAFFAPAAGNSSIVTVGTLTGGATGAGFTVALSTSTITGTLADARLSANVPLLNAANTFTAFGTHQWSAGSNAQNIMTLTNTTSGTAASAAFNVNAGTTNSQIISFSQGYTTSEPFRAASTMLYGSNGISIIAAAEDVRIYSRNALAATWGASGALVNVGTGAFTGNLTVTTGDVLLSTDQYIRWGTQLGIKRGSSLMGFYTIDDFVFYPFNGGDYTEKARISSAGNATFSGTINGLTLASGVVTGGSWNAGAGTFAKTSAVQGVFTGYSVVAAAASASNGAIYIGGTAGFAGLLDYDDGTSTLTLKATYHNAATRLKLAVGNTVAATFDYTGAATFAAGVSATTFTASAAEGAIHAVSTTGTNAVYYTLANSGGTGYIGQESSTGGSLVTGSTAYALVITPPTSRVLQLGYSGGTGVALTIGTTGNTTIGGTLGVTGTTTTRSHVPEANWAYDLGSSALWWRTAYLMEFKAAKISVQDIIVSSGGNLMVSNGSALTTAAASGDTTIYLKDNSFASGTFVLLRKVGQVEVMKITGAPGGGGPYSYTVERNKDGSGANDWSIGDGLASTGSASGDGWIEQYSTSASLTGYTGPATVYMNRTGTTWNNYATGAITGNLNGSYGYATNLYGMCAGDYAAASICTDPTNGVRFMNAGTAIATFTTSGLRIAPHTSGAATLNAYSFSSDATLHGMYGIQTASARTLWLYVAGGTGKNESLILTAQEIAGNNYIAELELSAGTAAGLVKVNSGNFAVPGYVQLGTATDSKPLAIRSSVDGTITLHFGGNVANTMIEFEAGAAGNTTQGSIVSNNNGTVTYNTTSDRRLKRDIVPTRYGLSDMLKLSVSDYWMTTDESRATMTGLIAQDVYGIYPLAVTRPKTEDGAWMLDYGRLTPLIIKGVQDVDAKVRALEARIVALESQIKQQEK